LFAPAEVSLFPPNRVVPGAELPSGFPPAAPPNRLGVLAPDVVAGFAPKKEEPVCAAPPAWLFWPPNSVELG
jgi:hypothetical protein